MYTEEYSFYLFSTQAKRCHLLLIQHASLVGDPAQEDIEEKQSKMASKTPEIS